MRVAIIQPSYFPWRGYFSIINSVDIFIFLDDVQYTDRDWRNRNKFEIDGKISWLTVPVDSIKSRPILNEVKFNKKTNWQLKHLETFRHNYSKTPFFQESKELFDLILDDYDGSLASMNCATTIEVSKYLGVKAEYFTSSNLKTNKLSPSEKLATLVSKVGGTSYISGPTAQNYLQKEAFTTLGIEVIYKNHDYPSYPRGERQIDGALSILDLISFHGKDSIKFI